MAFQSVPNLGAPGSTREPRLFASLPPEVGVQPREKEGEGHVLDDSHGLHDGAMIAGTLG